MNDVAIPTGRLSGVVDLARVRAWYAARAVVSSHPSIYLPLVAHKPSSEVEKIVDPTTEVVIEGFPRSGNTFAVFAFELAQGRPVRIAHHLHAGAQVARGVQLGIPTLVLVRDPADAVLSHLVRHPGITARQGLRSWIRFHRTVERVRDHVTIASFADVTTDFGAVTERLNERSGTHFAPFEHTPANVERCFRRIEERNRSRYARIEDSKIARPSPVRDETKRSLRPTLEAPGMRPLLDEARRLHDALVGS